MIPSIRAGEARRGSRAIALALALAAVVVAVLSQAVPSTEAVRLRNALLIAEGDPEPGAWAPGRAPPSFLRERLEVPALVARGAAEAVAGLPDDAGPLAAARAIAGHLNREATREGGIRAVDVEGTYGAMLSEHRGYCSDFIDVFVAMALSRGIEVRSWAFSFDGFGGHGHVVVEVHDAGAGGWVMLDAFNNVMPVERATRAALDVPTFRRLFARDPRSIEFVEVAPGPRRMPRDEVQFAYYARGIDEWYFWNGNNVVERAEVPGVRAIGTVFEPLAEMMMIVAGRYPSIVPVVTDTNRDKIAAMHRLRWLLLAASVVAFVLAVALVAELVRLASKRATVPAIDVR